MANKLIGDLQLRSSFDATCNIPVDDASQTWRTTGAQLLTYVSSNGGVLRQVSVVTKTTAYTLATTDEVVLGNAASAAFTLTLPTAVGAAGKVYRIKKIDTSFANAITIATTSSQTIDGATTRLLVNQNDSVELASDGANWFITSATGGQVSARFTTSAGQAMPSGADTIVNFGSTVVDTHSAVTIGAAWKFTCPAGKAGLYLAGACITWTANDYNLGVPFEVGLWKNGARVGALNRVADQGAANWYPNASGETLVRLAVGDYIDFRGYHTTGASTPLYTDVNYNHCFVQQVGN